MTVNSFDPAQNGWEMTQYDGFVGLVGPFWKRENADGSTSHGFEAEERHVNLLGVVQGGMLMTFADRSLGLEAWKAAGDQPSTTVQFNMNFIAAAQIGSFVEVTPVVTRATRSLIFMEGRLVNGETELATA
ncbi:MAG TPA: PaaI family thioesterase, partial [Marinobacter sp.]|nr:PaaI family thioesterase [Marinobacter sp.]